MLHQRLARLAVFDVIDWRTAHRCLETIQGDRKCNHLSVCVDREDHDARARTDLLHQLRRQVDLSRAAGRMTEREVEFDSLQLGVIYLFVLLGGIPHRLVVDLGPQARLDRHAERDHHHQMLLVLAFHLANGRRHEDHAGIAVEALMMRQADALVCALFLAILALHQDRSLLAELHPRALVRCPLRWRRSSRSSGGRGALRLTLLLLCECALSAYRKDCSQASRADDPPPIPDHRSSHLHDIPLRVVSQPTPAGPAVID